MIHPCGGVAKFEAEPMELPEQKPNLLGDYAESRRKKSDAKANDLSKQEPTMAIPAKGSPCKQRPSVHEGQIKKRKMPLVFPGLIRPPFSHLLEFCTAKNKDYPHHEL